MNKKITGKFVEYFSKPLNSDHITYLNNINNVYVERVELYSDFIVSLSHLVNDTYLGDDVMVRAEDIKSHFDWCWSQNIKNFSQEKLNFKKAGEHYYYFLNYFTEVYYSNPEKNQLFFEERILKFWIEIFSLSLLKTKSEYDVFIDVYKMLNKYFGNGLD